MHTLQCLGLFNFPYFVPFLRASLPWGAVVRACPPASCPPGWLCPLALFRTCHLRPEARLVPRALGPASWGRGRSEWRGAGEDILVCLCFLHSPPPRSPPRHLDHWLTFSSASKVLPRARVCVWVWLSSLVFLPRGQRGNFGGVGEKWGPSRGDAGGSWRAGLSQTQMEGRKEGRRTCPGRGETVLEKQGSGGQGQVVVRLVWARRWQGVCGKKASAVTSA